MSRSILSTLCLSVLALALVACEAGPTVQQQLATSLTPPPEIVVSGRDKSEKEVPVDYVVLQKKDRIISLWKQGRLVKTYPVLALGANPVGQKVYEGDERTPEGTYYISEKHPSQNFQKFLEISYPNEQDVKMAKRFGLKPGGHVGIHGDRGGFSGFWQRMKPNWTDGCIALRNADVEELYELVSAGTPIQITP